MLSPFNNFLVTETHETAFGYLDKLPEETGASLKLRNVGWRANEEMAVERRQQYELWRQKGCNERLSNIKSK